MPKTLKTSASTDHPLLLGQSKLWVLLVGVDRYQDERFSDLAYSSKDCEGVAAALASASKRIPKKQLIVHHDASHKPPTLRSVQSSLRKIISSAQADDTVLFYFSGHGAIDPATQKAMLCFRDTRRTDLANTALSMQDLLQSLEKSATRQKLLWLDACHSGNLSIQGAKQYADVESEATGFIDFLHNSVNYSQGFYALLSCDAEQRSWEFPELGHGVFSYYLIQGLRGNAADSQGLIEADSLYRYVYNGTVDYIDRINQRVRELNDEKLGKRDSQDSFLYPEYSLQTPKRIVNGIGDLVIGETLLGGGEEPSTLPQQWTEKPKRIEKIKQPTRLFYPMIGLLLVGFFSHSLSSSGIGQLSQQNQTTELFESNQPCNINAVPLDPDSSQYNAQILMNNCAVGGKWRDVSIEAFTGQSKVWALALSPDGRTLVSAGEPVIEIWGGVDSHAQARANEVQRLHRLKGHSDKVYTVAISPDGQMLASGSADQTIKIWNLQTGDLIRTLKGHTGAVWSVAFSPDNQTLVSGSVDKTIKLWDLESGETTRTLAGHQDWVFSVAISPDGQMLASSSQDKTIKLWDLQTGNELKTITGHDDAVRAIAFSPKEPRLASASWDGTVKVWDTATGALVRTFSGHSDRVVSVAYNPTGDTIASSSTDQTIKLWKMDLETSLGTMSGHSDWILATVFTPDNNALISSGLDQTIAVWRKMK
ncbi:caspase family protein [Oculatella sp. LEGE 06141]|uniref:WD40 domain-containing protein n=1 Tax=Oculatella sp. LEGE 06141 TaxID=1828648 RepID=UPI001880A693|nr:caspase family protein [Oculatella sp. LEGE 06141]MBE9180203.1 caspase family protein [Oculatella sp. LEGE 06141]